MTDPDQPNFEELYGQLEEAISQLETGDLSLGESLALFEQATRLAERCNALLDSAELQVRQLIERDGELTVEPLEGWQER